MQQILKNCKLVVKRLSKCYDAHDLFIHNRFQQFFFFFLAGLWKCKKNIYVNIYKLINKSKHCTTVYIVRNQCSHR